ncbi:hypothetical protein C8R45DRAFT_266011 [Mycena sanguinolenta]|nr:hypothetical protein C8R45DRAFT_266011 [Mycena sanguinolenta]
MTSRARFLVLYALRRAFCRSKKLVRGSEGGPFIRYSKSIPDLPSVSVPHFSSLRVRGTVTFILSITHSTDRLAARTSLSPMGICNGSQFTHSRSLNRPTHISSFALVERLHRSTITTMLDSVPVSQCPLKSRECMVAKL